MAKNLHNFKWFILNEAQAYMGQKVGDILTALQELRDDTNKMGTRDLVRFSERIVNQIRRILHSTWPKEEKKHLLALQKIAVAIMKAVDEKDNLPEIIAGSTLAMEKLVGKLGVPINKLAVTDTPKPQKDVETDKPAQDQSIPPPQPKTIDKSISASPPPGNQDQNLYAPPLGGNGGDLDAM